MSWKFAFKSRPYFIWESTLELVLDLLFKINIKVVIFVNFIRWHCVEAGILIENILKRANKQTVRIFGSLEYSDVSIKNIDILPKRQYIANTADLAQEQYS